MFIDEARLENGWLMLKTQPADAYKWLMKYKPGNYEIKQERKKRSLDANAYLWTLLDKLSAELRVPKEELYQMQIKQIGGVSDIVCIQDKAVDKFRDEWEKKGLGWQTDTIPSKIDGCTNVLIYYGSSAYDTKQFSRLLEAVVTDCKSIGIEVKPQEEIDSMLEEWGKT